MGPRGEMDEVRAADADRESTRDALNSHFSVGRLDLREFEERTYAASGARTIGELRALFADLPAPYPMFAQPRPQPMPTPQRVPEYPYTQPVYAPYGVEPITGRPYSDKQKVVAGLLQIFLGAFGIGRFYAGSNGVGLAQLLLTVLSFGILSLITVPWSIIDGIVMLAGEPVDGHGRPLR